MQVNAIQSNFGFTGKYQRNNRDIEDAKIIRNDYNNPSNNSISNRAMRNAAKAAVVGLFIIPVASPMLTSCDTEAYSEAWANATAKDSCCGKPIGGNDTITIHDTITQIIHDHDTIYIKKKFDSPVIDALRDFFEANDIDLGDGRIPLSITWVDENNKISRPKQLFDGKSSSYNELSYDVQRTPWDNETGSFIIGKGDTYENIRYSLTSDGKLMMARFVPRDPYKKPQARGEWVYSNSAVYDINKDKNVVDRYKINDDGSDEFAGTFTPGDREGYIRVTNPYGTEWNYTNVKVITGDAPEDDE